jgi:hypothetical protein
MIIIILICIGFGTSTHLTNAYGLTGLTRRNRTDDSGHSDDYYHYITCYGYVPCLGVHIYHSTRLLTILRCIGRYILGMYILITSFLIVSYTSKDPTRRMVSIDRGSRNDLFYGILEMGNVQKKNLRMG